MFVDLLNSVYTKSDAQILVIFVISSCMYAISVYCILNFTIGRLNLPQDNYFAVAIVGAMTSLVAVLLTFTLIQSINVYSRAKSLNQN